MKAEKTNKKPRGFNILHPNQLKKLDCKKAFSDGDRLYFEKSSQNQGRWFLKYTSPITKKVREFPLGLWPSVSLELARKRAQEAREKVALGIDINQERDNEKEAARQAEENKLTFKQFFDEWFAQTKKPSLTSDTNIRQWLQTINDYCKPILNKPIAEIDEKDIVEVLKPLWQTKNETARKLRNRLEQIFGAAIGQKRLSFNPAAYKNNLDAYLGNVPKNVKPHEALDYRLMAQYMGELRKVERMSAYALEFIILNASRMKEARLAIWSEIDFEAKAFTVPANRMKVRKNGEHRIPLSDRSIEILKKLKPLAQDKSGNLDPNAFVFIGGNGTRAISDTAISDLAKLIASKIDGVDKITVHGFRSSFRDWGFELGGVDGELMEVSLAHSAKGVIETYRRGNAFERRKILMQAWANYSFGKYSLNVVQMDKAA